MLNKVYYYYYYYYRTGWFNGFYQFLRFFYIFICFILVFQARQFIVSSYQSDHDGCIDISYSLSVNLMDMNREYTHIFHLCIICVTDIVTLLSLIHTGLSGHGPGQCTVVW